MERWILATVLAVVVVWLGLSVASFSSLVPIAVPLVVAVALVSRWRARLRPGA